MSSLKFGTSGLRGLAVDMLGAPSAHYTRAFLDYLARSGQLTTGRAVLVGRDLRDSSPAIARSVLGAILEGGYQPVDCGEVCTPALALMAQAEAAPAVMVTGSHIPADRNGLKFYVPSGEITKTDELGIGDSLGRVASGAAPEAPATAEADARGRYLARYTDAFAGDSLTGQRIGVFQHSSVLRDDLAAVLQTLGAEVVPLGRSDGFVPIDTEALSVETVRQGREWVETLRLDALMSTDGDADRPLVADETGAFLRGDALGILVAQFLGASVVVTPVTSNSAIGGLGSFDQVIRTKVGSPFVIAGMAEAAATGAPVVVGFEANGGLLLGSSVTLSGGKISALPTRDAMLPILAVLAAARATGMTLSQLAATLPPRFARSDRLEHVPQERTAALIAGLASPGGADAYFAPVGQVLAMSDLDGLRFTLAGGDVIHYRPSGNAPELRCYTEAATAGRADDLLAWGLEAAKAVVGQGGDPA